MKKISKTTDRKTSVHAAGKRRNAPSAAGNGEDAVPKPQGSAPGTERSKYVSSVTKKARARGKKPVRIGDALRQRGFDEHTIADHYVDVTHRLKGKSDTSGSVEKLLVDVLKECSKYLEPRQPERADERGGAAVHVHLVHSVPRPARDAHDGFASAKRDSSGQTAPLRMTARSGSDRAANGGDAVVAAESDGGGGEESDFTLKCPS